MALAQFPDKSRLQWEKTERMFLGEFQYSIDDKGRLTIPARFRKPLLEGLVITRGIERNLVIYPLSEWAKLAERTDNLPYLDREARNFRRQMFSGASDAEPDKQGRVNIPPYLLQYAQITKEVVVVGVNTYVELWSPELWSSLRESLDSVDNSDQWAKLGI